MSAVANELDALRREIDDLDDRIHDFLMRRTEVVERIRAVKSGGMLRPGREAQIVRRLLGRHRGSLPPAVVARIWRELISAFCRLQEPLKVAVCAPEKSVGYWDMVRRQYGSSTPMTLHRSAAIVLRAVGDGERTLGVLPLPQDGESDPWWPHLAGPGAPRIIARLPFVSDDSGQFEDVAALVVSTIEPEASGDDVTLVAIAVTEPISRARLNELVRQAGLDGHIIASHGSIEAGGDELHLIEVAAHLGPDDPRFARLMELARPVQRVVPIGAYAVPVRFA